jgi:hypothetical protein
MLNNARRIGLNEETQGEGVPGPVKTSAFDLESALIFAKRKSSCSNGGKDSPTTACASSKASHSTNEGSDGNSVSSPTAWSDTETSEARLTPVSSTQTAQITQPISSSMRATTDEARIVESLEASERMGNHPATSSTSYAPSLASEKAFEASSGHLRQMLQASDFGFDEGDESEREPSALSRDSSLDCITISPKPRQGPPQGEVKSIPASPPKGIEQSIGDDRITKASTCERLHHEDDDSDCEDGCLLQVRDRRIELDLELVKTHQKPQTVTPMSHDRGRRQGEQSRASLTVDEGVEAEREDESKDKARIAADLGLLRNHGGAHFVASAAAPLRKRTAVAADEKGEEKARRKAEKKAAKEAAKLATAQEAHDLDEERIAADLALAQLRRPTKQHDKKTRSVHRETSETTVATAGLKEVSALA